MTPIDATAFAAPRRLQVRGRAGVWEVIRDDRFYGHYMGHAAAFAAAEAAALAIVAKGGAADIHFREQVPVGRCPAARRVRHADDGVPARIDACRAIEQTSCSSDAATPWTRLC